MALENLADDVGPLGLHRDLLAEVQDLVQFGFWRWQIDTGEVWWSDQVYRIYGREPQESPTTFDDFLAAVHEDDLGELRVRIDAALAGSEEHDYRIASFDRMVRFATSANEGG